MPIADSLGFHLRAQMRSAAPTSITPMSEDALRTPSSGYSHLSRELFSSLGSNPRMAVHLSEPGSDSQAEHWQKLSHYCGKITWRVYYLFWSWVRPEAQWLLSVKFGLAKERRLAT
jgi:hypothetical protein